PYSATYALSLHDALPILDVALQVAVVGAEHEREDALAVDEDIHVADALEECRQREGLVAEGEAGAIDDLGDVAVTDGHLVVAVDLPIAVDVFVADVAWPHGARMEGGVGDLGFIFEVAEGDTAEVLAHLSPCAVLPFVRPRAVVFDHLVAVESEVTQHLQAHVAPHFLEGELPFDALVIDLADVAIGGIAHAEVARQPLPAQEDVFAVFLEQVGLDVQHAVEKPGFDAEVVLGGGFPPHVDTDFILRLTGVGVALVFTERVAVYTLVHGIEVGETAAADVAVAHLAPGGAEFKEVHHGLDTFEERLVRDHPSEANRREKAIPLFGHEVFRPVVAEVDLGQVLVAERIRTPARDAEAAVRQGRLQVVGLR